MPEEITAAQAARILQSAEPSVSRAVRPRRGLAAGLLEDMRRLDAPVRESRKKLAIAVKASGTSLTGIFGASPVIAATGMATWPGSASLRPDRSYRGHSVGRGAAGRPVTLRS